MLVQEKGLSLKQHGKIYQYCVRPVLLYCCKTWGLAVSVAWGVASHDLDDVYGETD